MKAKIFGVALICLLAAGCSDKPHHSVYGTDHMKIYNVKRIDNMKYGRFEYWVTDGTGKGWTLRTDDEYKLGDVLVIKAKGS